MTSSGSRLPSPRLALDTSAYSHFRSGHATVIDWIARAETVDIPATVLGELEAGFQLGSRTRENSQRLEEFLAEPFVQVLDVDLGVALRYGAIFARLRRAGTPIPVNDIWIAATVLEAGSHLVTLDSDFSRISGLPRTILRAK